MLKHVKALEEMGFAYTNKNSHGYQLQIHDFSSAADG
jgi:hypothetical protein